MHAKGATFGLYTAESPTTCGGYPASAPDHEALDAKTFAAWGVDYLKVDGCGPVDYYKGGYKAMGAGLEASGRDIVYSCSWPAYINGGNETLQPFGEFIMDGCNLWRNWDDIQCNWKSLESIIDHWGEYGEALAPYAGPGHWHDMDMLLVGAHCLTEDEEKTQMAIWSISAAPLIMGNDLRNVSKTSQAILQNKDAIAVNQDSLGQMGIRLSNNTATQVWARNLANGDVAVALYNKATADPTPILPPFDNSTTTCGATDTWTHTKGAYYEACGGASGDIGSFSDLTLEEAQAQCCANTNCAGFSFDNGSGFFKQNANCGTLTYTQVEGKSARIRLTLYSLFLAQVWSMTARMMDTRAPQQFQCPHQVRNHYASCWQYHHRPRDSLYVLLVQAPTRQPILPSISQMSTSTAILMSMTSGRSRQSQGHSKTATLRKMSPFTAPPLSDCPSQRARST